MKNKRISFLFMLGVLCLLFASGAAYIGHSMHFSLVLLMLVGIASLLVAMGTLQKDIVWGNKVFFFKRCFFFVLILVLSAALYAGINGLAVRFDYRWDATRFKQHTLSDHSIEVIHSLKAPVQCTAFYVGLPPKYLEDLLAEYTRISKGNITTEIVDPIRQIGYAAQFGDVIDGKQKKLFVISGQERREIDFTNESLNEEHLTNALIRVTRDKSKVYFLTGHGEASLSVEKPESLTKFAISLAENNIDPNELLLTDETVIPDDCDVLVIAGPREHYTGPQYKLIHEYLDRGGDALFLIEHTLVTTPDKPLKPKEFSKNPSLNVILNKWGVSISSDIVIDLDSHASGDVGSPATRNYKAHQGLTKGLDYTFYVRPRSIAFLSARAKDLKMAPFVLTESREKSWGETDRELNIKFDEKVDRAGPIIISAVVLGPKNEIRKSDTRLIVFTDADFLSDTYIDYYSNAQMGLNVIKWLSELDYKMFVIKDETQVARLDLTSRQKRMIAFILFCFPVLILCSGLLVWMKNSA